MNLQINKPVKEQDLWIEDLKVLNKERKSRSLLDPEINIFSLFEDIAKKYGKEEVVDFFIEKYISKNISQINSTFMKKKNEGTLFSRETNQQLINSSFNSIQACLKHFQSKKELIGEILSRDESKIKNIFIDKDLNFIGLYFLQERLLDKKNQEKLLNFSIRSGNIELFDAILNDYKGKKSKYENVQDNPFFWKPLVFNDTNKNKAEYMQDKLIGKEFQVTKDEIKKIRLANNSNTEFLSHIERLEKKSANRQIAFKL